MNRAAFRRVHARIPLLGLNVVLMTALVLGSVLVASRLLQDLVQKPRAQRVADLTAAYIDGVREVLATSAPAQRERFVAALTDRHDSVVRISHATRLTFDDPDSTLLQVFMARLGDRLPEVRMGWQDGPAQALWFDAAPPGTPPLWISHPAPDLPFTPLALLAILSLPAGLAAAGAWWVSRRLRRPLDAMERAVKAVGAGAAPDHLEGAGAREFVALSTQFNEMLRRLDQLDADRELMLAGVSHDLRTPLTRLRLLVALRRGGGGPLADDEAMLRAIREMDAVVGQFVDYARARDDGEDRVELDVNELVREVAAGFELDGRAFALDLGVLPPVQVRPAALQRALANLMGNAVHYAGRGLAMTTRVESDAVTIRVQDRGPGATPGELAHLGTPFVRSDAARAVRAGSGLGLAITRRLLERDGGTLRLATREGGGFEATLSLPAYRQPKA